MNDILTKFEGLKQEYESLKRNFRENFEKLSNLDKNVGDVTNNGVNALSKPLYNSFFKENKHISYNTNKSSQTIRNNKNHE